MSTPSIVTNKRLIHRRRYDSARLCVCAREKQRDSQLVDLVVDLWCYGLFLWWRSWFWSPRGSILTGGHIAILGPSGHVCPSLGVATAIATAFPIRWPLSTPGPPGQLSAQFGCNVQKIPLSVHGHGPDIMLVIPVECLTFPVLILLAHCPHTDLFVDHIDTRKAASEI